MLLSRESVKRLETNTAFNQLGVNGETAVKRSVAYVGVDIARITVPGRSAVKRLDPARLKVALMVNVSLVLTLTAPPLSGVATMVVAQ